MPDTDLRKESASIRLVRDLMTVGVATCSPDAPVTDIARLLLDKDLEAVVVLEPGEGHALGVVGREELVWAYTHPDVLSLKAEDVMQDNVPQAPPNIPLTAAAQIMLDQGVRSLFLMHHAAGVVYPAGVMKRDDGILKTNNANTNFSNSSFA